MFTKANLKGRITTMMRSHEFGVWERFRLFVQLKFEAPITLSTYTGFAGYLLIVFVVEARTVALTLIKVPLNKTKAENNHFCLTGKMARYVAEAMTAHALLLKHMFFRLSYAPVWLNSYAFCWRFYKYYESFRCR